MEEITSQTVWAAVVLALLIWFLIAISCPIDTKLCADGLTTTRRPFMLCTYQPCNNIQECGGFKDCPAGMQCLTVGNEKQAHCYSSDTGAVCLALCGKSDCSILESYPGKVECS